MDRRAFSRRTAAVVLGCLLLPFALLYWIVPWWSGSTLGNDYTLNSIHQQLELMLALQTGSFPLFVPTVYSGMTASALTLGQIHHPIAHLAVRLPGYWQGQALDWNTVLRLVSLALAHASLYAFLSRLGLGWRWSFGLGALTVYNLRMLDMFRYGASLESWAGYLMLCAALGVHAIEHTPVRGPLTIIGATAWLVCSGHPQMAFYGLAGAGALALLLPAFCATLLPDRPFRPRAALRYWLQAGACITAGIALSAAYVFPFVFEFLPETVTEGRYEWIDSYRDTLAGAVNNFFQPLRSDVHGAFGGSRLILVAALLPLVLVLGTRIPVVLWLAWAGGVVVFLHTLGGLTPLHGWMAQVLPFTSRMRVPGRLGMLLPVLLLLILAWLIKQEPGERDGGRRRVAPRTLLAGAACVLIGAHLMLPQPLTWDLSDYSPLVIRHVPAWAGTVSTLLGLAALVALALHGMRRGGHLLEALVMLTAILESGIALRYGTWEEPWKPTPTLARMVEQKRHDLATLVFPGERLPTVVLAEHERRGAQREPVLARVTGEYTVARDQEEAYALVAGRPSSQPLVVELDPAEARTAAESAAVSVNGPPPPAPAEGARVALHHAAFNRLVFKVWSARPGFFCLAYPYTGHWRAEVNGQQRPVHRANGAAHAVRVPAGYSTVEFRYVSRSAVWGMVLSCLAGSGLAVLFGLRVPRRSLRIGALVAAVLIAVAGWAWRQSLYRGHGFGTVYTWSSSP